MRFASPAKDQARPQQTGPIHPHVVGLLETLFDAQGLRTWLLLGPDREELRPILPEGNLSLRDLAHEVVEILVARKLLDSHFFGRLVASFPRREQDIRAVQALVIQKCPGGPECPPIRAANEFAAGLTQRLTQAIVQHRERVAARLDAADVEAEILQLKRALRRGPVHQPGEVLLDRYHLLERIGSGGFATVWRAYDNESRSLVAVKILHCQWTGESSYNSRFDRGARKMHDVLHHPNIVRIHRTMCEDDGFYFCVMELIEGTTLHRAIVERDPEPLTTRDILEILIQTCDALAHAHAHSIIHRDVKPHNILLNKKKRAYLTDFDLLKAKDTTGGTRTGAGLGTLFFSAPEALSDASKVDERADVYSLGMTLLFALLGRDLDHDDVYDHLPARISGLPAPTILKNLLREATARRPARRLPSVDAFRDRLIAALPLVGADAPSDAYSPEEDEPEPAVPPGPALSVAPPPTIFGRLLGSLRENNRPRFVQRVMIVSLVISLFLVLILFYGVFTAD